MDKKNRILTISKGVLFSYLITFFLIIIYSAILAYTKLPENTIPVRYVCNKYA